MFCNKILKIIFVFLIIVNSSFFCYAGNADSKKTAQVKQKNDSNASGIKKNQIDLDSLALMMLLLGGKMEQQKQQQRQKTDELIRSIPKQCFRCNGSGWRVMGKHQCLSCNGTGLM